MNTFGVADLALIAASICPNCRNHGRPSDDSDQEHGDSFAHHLMAGPQKCEADQLWYAIRRLEQTKK